MIDIIGEAIGLVRCMVDKGAVKDTAGVCDAIERVAAVVMAAQKGIRPVAACSAAEYQSVIKSGNVLCLECGEEVQALGSHVMKAHSMGWGDYMDRWGFWFEREGIEPRKAGATLSARRRDNAIMMGLGAQGQQPKKERGEVKAPRKEKARLLTVEEAFEYNAPFLSDYIDALTQEQRTSREGAELVAYIKTRLDLAQQSEELKQAEIEAYNASINLK